MGLKGFPGAGETGGGAEGGGFDMRGGALPGAGLAGDDGLGTMGRIGLWGGVFAGLEEMGLAESISNTEFPLGWRGARAP